MDIWTYPEDSFWATQRCWVKKPKYFHQNLTTTKKQFIIYLENNVNPLCNHLYRPNRPYLLVSNFKVSLECSSKPTKYMLYKKDLMHHFWLVLTLTCNIWTSFAYVSKYMNIFMHFSFFSALGEGEVGGDTKGTISFSEFSGLP